jgi:glycosyltransferase involved in cell wall biosynthesis
MEGYREPGIDYVLDALNPLTWAVASRMIVASGCDLAIIDWWTLFWAPAFAWIARYLRRHEIATVFLCHNLFDHESSHFKQALSVKFLSQADAYLVHSRGQADDLHRLFPHKKIIVHPHPVYDRFPAPSVRLPKRGRLELLFFGFIRPYKGLEVLIDALAQLDDTQVYLTVVGESWLPTDELRKRIATRHAPNIELHLDYVDDQNAANFFGRADLVVLPYLSASGSGVAAMAFHYGCPVLATRTGAFPELIDDGKTGYLVDPGSSVQIAECLRRVTRDSLALLKQSMESPSYRFSWQSLADALIDLAGSDYRPDAARRAVRNDTL